MLYSTRRVAAATAFILLGSIALAGCSTGSNMTVTHNPPLSTFGGKSTARSAVQTVILVANTSTGIAVPGGPTPATVARRVLDVMHGRRLSSATGPCTNGTKTSQITNADGSVKTTTDSYYDTPCTLLEEEQVLTVATPGDPETSAAGTVTTYDRTGAVTSYHTLAVSAANDSGFQTVTYSDAAAATVAGAVLASVGATCTGTPNSAAMSCTSAMYGTSTTATFGQAISQNGVAGSGGTNSVTFNVSFYGAGITGIGQTNGAWGVSGPSAFNGGSGTYSYSSTGSTGSGTLSLTDSLYTYTVTGKLTATGLAVTIVRNSDPIATASIDPAGNGAITYVDGTSDVIWGNVIGV